MRLNNKGGIGFLAMETMVGIFIVVLIFAVLDNVLREDVFPTATSMGANATVITNLTTSWSAFPWIFIGASFLVLVMAALARAT